MRLRDRKMLARLMVIQRVSQRRLAEAAGWRSHSYLGRLMRGEAHGVDPRAAQRIADQLCVPVSVLFAPDSSPESVEGDQEHLTIGGVAGDVP